MASQSDPDPSTTQEYIGKQIATLVRNIKLEFKPFMYRQILASLN